MKNLIRLFSLLIFSISVNAQDSIKAKNQWSINTTWMLNTLSLHSYAINAEYKIKNRHSFALGPNIYQFKTGIVGIYSHYKYNFQTFRPSNSYLLAAYQLYPVTNGAGAKRSIFFKPDEGQELVAFHRNYVNYFTIAFGRHIHILHALYLELSVGYSRHWNFHKVTEDGDNCECYIFPLDEYGGHLYLRAGLQLRFLGKGDENN